MIPKEDLAIDKSSVAGDGDCISPGGTVRWREVLLYLSPCVEDQIQIFLTFWTRGLGVDANKKMLTGKTI